MDKKRGFVKVTKHYGYLPMTGWSGVTWYYIYTVPFSYVGDQIYNHITLGYTRSMARKKCRELEKQLEEHNNAK